jgi:hypothetical protein
MNNNWITDTSLQLHSIITAYNQWLHTTRPIPCWTTRVFSSTVTNDEQRNPAHTLNCLEGSLFQKWMNDESESRITLWLVVYSQSVRLGAKPLETHGQNFFFQSNTYDHSPYVTSSLMRRWVCHLQLLLALASAFILSSESCRTCDRILLTPIPDSPNVEARSRYLHYPVIPQALGSLSIAFYDSHGYGGGDSNLPPHPGGPVCYPLTHKFEADRIQNTAPAVPPLFAFVFVAAQAWTGQVSCCDRRSISQSAPEQSTHLGPMTRLPPLSDSRPPPPTPRQEDGSASWKGCWPSPAQSISGPSPATTLTGSDSRLPPSSPCVTRRATVEVLYLAFTPD